MKKLDRARRALNELTPAQRTLLLKLNPREQNVLLTEYRKIFQSTPRKRNTNEGKEQ